MKRTLLALALVGLGYLAGVSNDPAGAQVANENQRTIRAMESQADSLKSIAASLKRMERCR